MNTNKIIALVILVALLIGLIVFARTRDQESVVPTPQQAAADTYSSNELGVSFEYPDDYYLEEKDLSTPQRTRKIIVLYEDTEENSAVREGTTPPREGPTAITLDFFKLVENETYTPEGWVRGTNDSNYKLSPDGEIAPTTVDGIEAVSYRWSGLYEGRSTVFIHNEYVVMASVTFLTPEDEIISLFESLLENIDLQ